MKSSLGYWFGAIVLAVLGTVALIWGRVEHETAQAEQRIATLDFSGVDESLTRAERFYEHAARVPFFGTRRLNEIRARKAAVHYWQRDYDAIVPSQADPVGAVPPDNVELQFIVANAVFRHGRKQAATPAATMQAIDSGIAAQLAVLKNSQRNEDAAFNYEYLLRLRAAVALKPTGGRASDEEGDQKTTHGQPGGAPRKSDPTDFKILIPLESKEFENQKEGQQAGKAAERQRKG
jgi:hypothetical protein